MSFAHFPSYIFMASSSEGLAIAEKIHVYLDRAKAGAHKLACVEIWDDVFTPSRTVIETLENASGRFDFALIVLTPDDILTVRGETGPAPRDNVNFELGFFMAKLGRDRCLVLRPGNVEVKMPSDLAGITWVSYTYKPHHEYASGLRAPATKLAERIRSVGSRGPTNDFFIGWGYVVEHRRFEAHINPNMLRPYVSRSFSLLVIAFTGEDSTFMHNRSIAIGEPWPITPLLPRNISIHVSCEPFADSLKKRDRVWGVAVLMPADMNLVGVTCIGDIIARGGRVVDAKGNFVS